MFQQIKSALEYLHLSNGEIEVYAALLKNGLSTTGTIMQHAKISNSKVYEVLDKLIKKGLASYVIQNGKRHYAATPPRHLLDYLEEQKQELQESQDELKKLIPSIEKIREETTIPEATIYRGKKGALVALNETFDFCKNEKGEAVGFGTEDYPTYFPAQIAEYMKGAKKYKFKQRLIFGEGFKSPNPVAKIRFLPKEYILPVRTMIYGNTVAIVDFTDPMTTVILNKKSIADTYKNHFNLLWKIAKP